MTEEQIAICKEVLKKFIYKIRTNNVCQMVFHYYSDSDEDRCKTYKMHTPEYYASFNTDRTERQIKHKILSARNNYWNLNDSKIKILETCASNLKEFDRIFGEYIEFCWNCSLSEQAQNFEKEEKDKKKRENLKLELILKEKYDSLKEVVNLILDDTSEYPYKSDKIKVLLELELDVETIFMLLQTREKWNSPRGYINKYFEERKEGIRQKKIAVYELDSTIRHITSQLKNRQ